MTATYDPRPDWSREDREREIEAQRPQLETLVVIPHEVWGYWADHDHASVVERDDCEAAGHAYLVAEAEAERRAEEGYERWLEDRGHLDALEDSYREAGLLI